MPQTLGVYPKNSYMSYRSERKLGRQVFDGKYWRSSLNTGSRDSISTTPQDSQSRVSPASWEKLHNIRRQGTTLIFHSNSMRGRTSSDSKSNLDRGVGAIKSNPEHKSPMVPAPTSQTIDTIAPTSVCNQLVTSDPINRVSSICVSVGQDPQRGSPSHNPSHTEKISSFLSLEDDQKVDSSVTSLCPSLYSSEVSVHYPQLLEVEKQLNPNVNGQLDEELPTTHNITRTEAIKRNEALSEDRSSEVNPVQQILTDQHRGLQPNSLVGNGGQIPVSTINCATQTTDTPRLGRRYKTKEEIECERLSKDFVNHCDDTMLIHLLVPAPNHKTMSDYMDGLFNLELEKGGQPVHRNRSSIRAEAVKLASISDTPINSENRKENELPPNSAYYTTSEPKAKLLTRYSQDMDQQDWASENELSSKKEELIASIDRKLKLLRLEQVSLREEMVQNEALGQEVTSRVEQLAKPNEIEKYRLHVEEMEKIINLLLSLSGRLARAQNALMCLLTDVGDEEKRVLQAKCDKLSEQHEEARRLKESIDKRSHQVSLFLHRYLSSEEYADYDHFIKMKSKLLMDAREIDEKIKLGEEQLAALRNNVNFQIWKQVHTKSQGSLGT
ncbi:protein Shroom3-like [Limulus polyphemus]|uniref:Protein Shroom3-like n=1 Tax=Limulus polyphemus TaxID=6850 RepID=A0ABM1BE99_LIMPO|nr:protein Shroom3-like [Limulus polyphemus]